MDRFLPYNDDLGNHINSQASELMARITRLDLEPLDIPEYCKIYFQGSHAHRIFFSIETSAHILYRSLKILGKEPHEINLMDYGAGVGTLFMLARLIGVRKVIYNDHLLDWKQSAETMANALSINIDEYIVGDISDTLSTLEKKNIQCDIVTSRNVVEHIYDLKAFYDAVHAVFPDVLVFSSTTANIYNPGSRLKHLFWHRKWEKLYHSKRKDIIRNRIPTSSNEELEKITKATRGLAVADLDQAINTYIETKQVPDPSIHRSNTCDPATGVWAEHLLYFTEYRSLIDKSKFVLQFAPGFWDTHYSKPWKNSASALLNKLMKPNSPVAFRLAPFIYVIAKGRGR